jgi:membrane protein implicated in regulation of membrane protease activity
VSKNCNDVILIISYFHCSFNTVAVITKWGRWLGWFCVAFLNLFFLYFSVLRSMTRSQSWQNQFVLACVLQFVIEVFLFESVTVLWVNWVIPRLACGDVGAVITSLRTIITTSLSHPEDWMEPLDTANYFFVSTLLAKQYPHLLESIIVQSFHSYLPPGRMSNLWSTKNLTGARSDKSSMFWKMFSLSALVFGALQIIGTLNMEFQSFIMSIVLPVALAACFVVGNFMYKYPVAFSAIAVVLVYVVGSNYLKKRRSLSSEEETMILNKKQKQTSAKRQEEEEEEEEEEEGLNPNTPRMLNPNSTRSSVRLNRRLSADVVTHFEQEVCEGLGTYKEDETPLPRTHQHKSRDERIMRIVEDDWDVESNGDEKTAIDTLRIRRVLPSDDDNEETQGIRNERNVQIRHNRSLHDDHSLVGEASWIEGVAVPVGRAKSHSHADMEAAAELVFAELWGEVCSHADMEAAAELVFAELWGDVSDGEDSESTPGWASISSSSYNEEEEELVLAELWGDVSDNEDSEFTPGWASPSSSSEEEEEIPVVS